MTPDFDFLKDVEALARFVEGLQIDDELRGRVERIKCDVHDMKRGLEKKTERRALRDRVKRQTFAEMR